MQSPLDLIVVFQRQNLDCAIRLCQSSHGNWSIVCAFELPDDLSSIRNGVSCTSLFSFQPYQPILVTWRVREIIKAFFQHTELDGVPLHESFKLNGVPLLLAKDNDLMEYTLHRLVFVVDALLKFVGTPGSYRIHLLIDRGDQFSVPEWLNIDRLLDLDAVYGPVFSQAAKLIGHELVFLGYVSMRSRRLLHRSRELALVLYRCAIVFKRAFLWRDEHLPRVREGSPLMAIWVRSKGQVREIESLVRRWIENGGTTPFFFQDDSFKKQDCINYLRSGIGLHYVSAHRYLSVRFIMKALRAYLRFRFSSVCRLKYKPIDLSLSDPLQHSLLSPYFRRELAGSLAESILSSSINVLEMSSCHERLNFKTMLVMSNYDQWGHIAGYLGRELGFKTISIQNFATDPWAYPTPYSLYDAHIVYDTSERDKLIGIGAPVDRIFPLGGILYSQIRDQALQKKRSNEIRLQLGIKPKSRVILLGTQSAAAIAVRENAHCLQVLFDVIARQPGSVGLVKIHPYERLSDYGEWRQKATLLNLDIRFFDDKNIDELMSAADIYVSRSSTTLMLSVLMRKPTLSFVTPSEELRVIESSDFIRIGIVEILNDFERAFAWLHDLFDDAAYQQVVQKQEEFLLAKFSTYDDQGSERIKSFVEKFVMEGYLGDNANVGAIETSSSQSLDA